jgi:AcrR family transcriptional regulator
VTRRSGEATRRRLLQEAVRQFGRHGYEGGSLEAVANAAGVRRQTLLYYFPSKEALLEACVGEVSARVAQALAEALERFAAVLEPLRLRALGFLARGMNEGEIRRQDPALLLFTLYTAVIGTITEAGVLRAVVGEDRSRIALHRREREVVEIVRNALAPAPEIAEAEAPRRRARPR